MNYDTPRQIMQSDGSPSGKWHYTSMNDKVIRPVGYCAHGCDGHDTPEEAAEHQRQYMLATNLALDWQTSEWRECVICGDLTKRHAAIPLEYKTWPLCDRHRTAETVAKLYEGPGIGMSIHS
jgi:hypothetical protein